jgi:hypothetical protein
MKLVITALAAAAALGLAACGTGPSIPVAETHSTTSPSSTRPAAPAPTVTKTIIKREHAPVSLSPAPAPSPVTVPNVTDPWAVVSAYYGDIESGNYLQAWALISSGMVTSQTYQQFASGFGCTGAQQLTELGESGDQVQFDLAATDDCSGAVQQYTGTDTVVNGKIVAADVAQTG